MHPDAVFPGTHYDHTIQSLWAPSLCPGAVLGQDLQGNEGLGTLEPVGPGGDERAWKGPVTAGGVWVHPSHFPYHCLQAQWVMETCLSVALYLCTYVCAKYL